MESGINSGDNSFAVPGGYFGKSAAAIANHLEWTEEMRDFPRLAAHDRSIPFITPGNFFEKCERRTELMAYPRLAAHPKNDIFAIPEDFFESAPIRIVLGVKGGKAILKNGSGMDHFSLPEGFFGQKKLDPQAGKEGKIISINRVMMSMAACLLVVLAIWIYNSYFTGNENAVDCKTIACVDKKDVINSRSFENLDSEDLYELVNSRALEQKLQPATDPDREMDSLSEMEDEAFDDI